MERILQGVEFEPSLHPSTSKLLAETVERRRSVRAPGEVRLSSTGDVFINSGDIWACSYLLSIWVAFMVNNMSVSQQRCALQETTEAFGIPANVFLPMLEAVASVRWGGPVPRAAG